MTQEDFERERNVTGRIAKGMEWNGICLNASWILQWCSKKERQKERQGQELPREIQWCFCSEWKPKQCWCRAMAHRGVRRDGKWRTRNLFLDTSNWGFWVGKGAWVPLTVQLVSQCWKKPWETPPQLQLRGYPSVRRLSHVILLMQIHVPGGLWGLWVVEVTQMTGILVSLLRKM